MNRWIRFGLPLVPALVVGLIAVAWLGWPGSNPTIVTISGPIVLGPDGKWTAPFSGNFVETTCGACKGTNPLLVLGLVLAAYAVAVVVLRWRRNPKRWG